MPRRVKIGDIIEIKTKKGLFYAQYTHYDEECGELIQVKKGSHKQRPSNFEKIVNKESTIITFIPLNICICRKIFEVVDNLPVPLRFQAFPTFLLCGHIDRKGKVKQWLFWDGEKTWPETWVTELTDEQKKLPIQEIWNDTLLIEQLESGWTPETDPCKN